MRAVFFVHSGFRNALVEGLGASVDKIELGIYGQKLFDFGNEVANNIQMLIALLFTNMLSLFSAFQDNLLPLTDLIPFLIWLYFFHFVSLNFLDRLFLEQLLKFVKDISNIDIAGQILEIFEKMSQFSLRIDCL